MSPRHSNPRPCFGEVLTQSRASILETKAEQTMKPIKTTLLYSAPPKLDSSAWHRALETRLKRSLSARPTKSDREVLRLISYDMSVSVEAVSSPFHAPGADRLTASIIAAPTKAELDASLVSARDQLVVTITPMPGEGVYLLPRERLDMLHQAHAAVSAIVAQTTPDLVVWHHGGQAVTGRQYAQIADELEPIALFARAVIEGDDVCITPHSDLLDRPIRVARGKSTIEHAYAAGLAFLRHAIAIGTPLPDGDSFGPVRGCSVDVLHAPANPEAARPAEYDLRMRPLSMPQKEGRAPGPNATALASVQASLRDRAKQPAKPAGPAAIMSTIMSFSLPPLGLVLLVTNALMGSNAFRSAMITMGSLALALFTASWVVISERGTVPISIAAASSEAPFSAKD